MARFKPIDPATATGQTKVLLDAVKQKFGMVPNITRMMANSPAVLEGYLSFGGALAAGDLDPQLRERIAIAVASANNCELIRRRAGWLASRAKSLWQHKKDDLPENGKRQLYSFPPGS